jgi:serine/threonine-protein kinase
MPELSLLQRLKERKLVQWALAYLAGAFFIYTGLDPARETWGIPESLIRGIHILLIAGFFITLVLAWYHGEKGRQRVSGPELLMVAALLVIAGGMLTILPGRRRVSEPTGTQTPAGQLNHPLTAIAVLPFQNFSADGPYAFFAGGLHDELLTQLARVKALTVMGRTSVMPYAGGTASPREIADELRVGSIVEGSVQILGDRLRVNVQLIDPQTGGHRWADSYDRTLDDAFAIQSEIARQVVAELGAELSEGEARAIAQEPTQDPEAYRLYLQGEEYRLRPGFERQNLEIAQQFFERAIAQDSSFALAYATLAEVHGSIYWLDYDPYPARLERSRQAAEGAVRVAPDLPQARWALGVVHYREGDYARALEELTSVAEELPGSAELWGRVGYAHRRLGNWDETLAAFETAVALDPRDADLFDDLGGSTLRFLHRYREAIEAKDRAIELAPDFWGARLDEALVHLHWRGTLDSLRSVLEQGPEAYGMSGTRDLWRARMALWEREPDTLLALLGAPEEVTFEAHGVYEPGLLYAAWAHQLRGQEDAAAQAFAGALAQLDFTLQELPDDWRVHASRGLTLAGLGQVRAARLEADWLTRSRMYRYTYDSSSLSEARAMIFAQAGLAEEALAELEPLFAGPSWTSAAEVRLDPRYDPIRDHPRFQAMLEQYRDDEG